MKRYRICLYLFLIVGAACLATGMAVTRHYKNEVSEEVSQEVEERLQEMTREARETQPESAQAANVGEVSHETEKAAEEEYYLVCEDGFLLVFLKDQKTICLYTHIPIMDFPEREQERLREGIWFENMMEVFHYLESYTS